MTTHLQSQTNRIPAGIERTDLRCEIYSHNQEPYVMRKGESIAYSELPAYIRKYYFNRFLEDATALESLEKDMGLYDIQEKFYKWLICNYGGFDFEPDFDDSGDNAKKEYWNCGCRGDCPAEGKVCKPWVMTHYHLSIREVAILKHIALGKTSEEIAMMLYISTHTVDTHSRNIKEKVGAHNKAHLAMFAAENNII